MLETVGGRVRDPATSANPNPSIIPRVARIGRMLRLPANTGTYMQGRKTTWSST